MKPVPQEAASGLGVFLVGTTELGSKTLQCLHAAPRPCPTSESSPLHALSPPPISFPSTSLPYHVSLPKVAEFSQAYGSVAAKASPGARITSGNGGDGRVGTTRQAVTTLLREGVTFH